MREYSVDNIVVGTGAAGYNGAIRLKQFGAEVAIVTEGVNSGTSRNTGSDKQTYYKLGLGGDCSDSVRAMAENLFGGGSVDGDNALCEAALSVRSFMNLVELGVQFPTNRYGEYVGYKTDHDPYARATSVGPLTSKLMTEALQKRAEELLIPVYSELLAIEVLRSDGGVSGLLCLDIKTAELVAFKCKNIILATGGPAGIYRDSVYPKCHTGTTSLALMAGAKAQNLTEWQYGLASVDPRWNVSGTYMQVLPRFVSIDSEGREHEFLAEYFSDIYEALSMVFLKGYQWPFDSKKVLCGSSVIDILVYRECVLRKRRVYLDFTKNPFGLSDIDYTKLSEEAYVYLKKAGACFGTPIERLLKMNSPAVDLYESKGVDIRKEYLEIALCAQHNNGGIAVDLWWQTSLPGLFAAGECAGTHGVTRPGGSALNAGQVGSLRAAMYIGACEREYAGDGAYRAALSEAVARHTADIENALKNEDNIVPLIYEAQQRMSECASAIRNAATMESMYKETAELYKTLSENAGVASKEDVFLYYKYKDILITQLAVLCAMIDYSKVAADTRGSSLYYDKNGDLRAGLEEIFRFSSENTDNRKRVQEVMLSGGEFCASWRDVRQLPLDDDFFENVWRGYRENKNIY